MNQDAPASNPDANISDTPKDTKVLNGNEPMMRKTCMKNIQVQQKSILIKSCKSYQYTVLLLLLPKNK